MKNISHLLLLALLIPALAFAQDGQEPRCLEGQWVLTVPDVPRLQQIALERLDTVTRGDLEIAETSQNAMLVSLDGETVSDETVPEEIGQNPCKKLKALRREMLRNDERIVVGFPECSCNAPMAISRTPNDGNYPLLWGMNQTNDVDIDAPEAWELSTGLNSTVVAVIDTGVDYNHPDLAANKWVNPGEIAGNGIDDDNNGYVDDIHGINAITNSGNPMDDQGHGTHVAGTIGGVGNNGTGVSGVNWQVKIMGAKFLSSTGSGSLYDAVKSIDYVTMMKNRGINIVASNNSWGGGGFYSTLYDSIARSRNAGVLFIAAAGNSSSNNDVTPSYPSNYNIDNVVAVAAVDREGNLASFSSYGATTVDIAAPGVQIASSIPGGQYSYMSGTSMATPHVTGVVALLASYATRASWTELKAILLRNGKSLPSLQGVVATGKMIKAYSMLRDAEQSGLVGPPPTATPTPSPQPTSTPLPTATPMPSPTPTPTAVPGYKDIDLNVTVNGVPIGQAKVVFRSANGVEKIGYTAADGKIKFYNLYGPVMYTIDIIKAGYSFNQISSELRTNASHSVYGTALGYQLKVVVKGSDSAPIVGATVNAGNLGSFSTDSSGRVTIPVIHGQSYSLSVSKSGLETIRGDLQGEIYGNVERVVIAIPLQ